ncbi:murinoglobulin-1-like isoform X2 [Tubulanus polymorphus]|uniref:murinoglobulin-1-like isoform X2 n=1 Tax=Tubulanus polymorphus TaxID=672921 RepID=UPI003DA322EC
MLRIFGLLAVFCIVPCALTTSETVEKRGFLMTAPNTFTMGKDERLCFTFHDIDCDVNVNVSLSMIPPNQRTEPHVISKSYLLRKDALNHCVHFKVPIMESLSSYISYKLAVVGSTVDATVGYKFNDTVFLKSLIPPNFLTFIETDKPIYKPGQTVKFRTLTVTPKLMPLVQTLEEVYVKDSLDNRVAQWRNAKTENGLGDFELPLSDEPILGTWSIHLKSGTISESHQFEVREYVLPKFQVDVNGPPYFYVVDKTVKVQVCAKYTYGKPVIGDIEATLQIKSGNRFAHRQRPPVTLKEKINRCTEFSLSADRLGLNDSTMSVWNTKLHVFAKVKETATGVILNGSSSSPLETQRFKFDSTGMPDFFKPGLPYMGKGVLRRPDGTPAAFQEITLNIDGSKELEQEKQILTNEEGVYSVYLPKIGEHVKRLNIMVKFQEPSSTDYSRHRMRSSYNSVHIRNWYSKSGYAVQIINQENTMECNKAYDINVTYTTDSDSSTTFYYQAMTKRGEVVEKGRIGHYFKIHDYDVKVALSSRRKRDLLDETASEPELAPAVGESDESDEVTEIIDENEEEGEELRTQKHIAHFKINLFIKPELSGGVRLLVYSVRPDGEVIADSQEFAVASCFRNKVSLNFEKEKALPGAPVNLKLNAAPGSLCSVGVVDKSVHLLKANKQLTPAKVVSLVDSFSLRPETFEFGGDHCRNADDDIRHDPRGPPMPAGPPGDNRQRRDVRFPWSGRSSSYYDSIKAFKDVGVTVISNLQIETRPCHAISIAYRKTKLRRKQGRRGPVPMASGGAVIKQDHSVQRRRKERQATSEIRSYFPETWLFDLETVGPTGELNLEKRLPHTITEWVGRSLCTNLQMGMGLSEVTRVKGFQPFFVSFTLPYSVIRGEKVPVLVTVFNYLTQCLVIDLTLRHSDDYTINGTNNAAVCVCANEQKSHTFYVIPKTLGKVNITVYAYSSDKSLVCGNIILTQTLTGEGASDAVVRQLLVEAEGIEEEYSLSSLVCPDYRGYSTTFDLNLPENLVPDSARAQLSVVGDLMGPTLSGLDKLLTVPVGCGEQNMITFTPNIFVLQYLTATKQLTPNVEAKALAHMKRGYQRELNYRHNDGSFSAFGNSDPSGSMWLTAFVVKSFAQSKPYIFIDDEHLQKSIDWFKSQQLENGCFPQVGRVLHKDMKGGLSGGSSTVGLTTFVLMAMLEAGLGSESTAVVAAVGCLESQTIDQTDPYLVALMAYTYSLYNPSSKKALDLMAVLLTLSINSDGMTHWQRPAQPIMEVAESWKPHHQAASADVELTSYALMALLNHKGAAGVAEALPIVKWIARQRNSAGGFTSTQDTIVALQALADYAALAHKKESLVYTSAQGSHLAGVSFSVNDDNRLLLQKRTIQVPDLLVISANGTGCALLQASVKYNIKKSVKLTPAFTLNTIVSRKRGECKKRSIGICTTYTRPDGASNMAVIEVRMVSGWIPVKATIQKLVQRADGAIKKFEVSKNYVYLYYNELTAQRKCLSFDVERHMDIDFAKPGYVKVYDYYETDLNVIQDYSILPGCKRLTATKEDLPHLTQEEFDRLSAGEFAGQLRLPAPAQPQSLAAPKGFRRKTIEKVAVEENQDKKLGCPVCVTVDSAAVNITTLYCDHASVYKTMILRDGRVRLMAKFGANIRGKVIVNKYVKYEMDGMCNCDFFEADAPPNDKYAFFINENQLMKKNNVDTLLLTDETVGMRLTREIERELYFLWKKNPCRSM